MRSLIVDMLSREHSSWAVSAIDSGPGHRDAVSVPPDLVIIDAADFSGCSQGPLADFPAGRTVVIGPEPDPSYRRAVLDRGAGAWLSREDLGEELSGALRQILGCSHCPCPPPDGDAPVSPQP
ncbi:MAG: hypothetical protein M3Y04_07075 [Actinomycetota bacterium]|nr:hypothetical protein [Actinomycetota bacterium]